jgi:NADPH-dependent curcumin reductase CurA
LTASLEEVRKWQLTFTVLARVASSAVGSATVRLGRTKQDRVVGVSLNVLLEILGALECLSTKVALMRL